MFAIRVADWLSEEKGTGKYLDSKGNIGEPNVWGKKADWARLEGNKDGKTIGIAIFNHPASACFPTYWHARGYGLFSADPLGQLDFLKGRNVENPQPLNFTLNPGQSALFRFRMIIYEGQKTAEQLEQAFQTLRRRLICPYKGNTGKVLMTDNRFAGDKKLPMRTFLARWEKKFIDGNVSKFPRWIRRISPHTDDDTVVGRPDCVRVSGQNNLNWLCVRR